MRFLSSPSVSPTTDQHAGRLKRAWAKLRAVVKRVPLLLGLRVPQLLGALVLVLPLATSAQEVAADSTRIGFVDIPWLIDRAPQALEAEKRLEAEFQPRQEELEEQRAELARHSPRSIAKCADSSVACGAPNRISAKS
ncbi:MAG: hypothetical protein CSA54_05825 [Gammaproteobacteria bacterium]|nr:MAG: hypothetical protein CSA54_05825 [Gammaproteobacteria bacterium]